MWKHLAVPAVAVLVGGCSLSSLFEQAAPALEPLYCYRALGTATGSVTCYGTPSHRDARRLVSYYGPPPETYPRPAASPPPTLKPPPPIDFYVLDPEPIPSPAPRRPGQAYRER